MNRPLDPAAVVREAVARSGTPPALYSFGEPDMSVLRMNRRRPPVLDLDVFGPFWRGWIERTAEATNAPTDYVAVALLAAISALIGNARHVSPWPGWREPPVLWVAAVGDPASGKTPGAAPIWAAIGELEATAAAGFADVLRDYKTKVEWAKNRHAAWEREVTTAEKSGTPPPTLPADAMEPTAPEPPRIVANNATLERLAAMLAGLPKGLLYRRDELAGWFGSFDRYGGAGADRAFWLESCTGGSHVVDRVKHPEPLRIPHLAVALFGTIQPERLAEVLGGADDGLAARFLWSWPEALPFRRPHSIPDHGRAVAALRRLHELAMGSNDHGQPVPVIVPFSPMAAELMERLAAEMQERSGEAVGPMKGALGKVRGQAARLALVLEFMWWAAEPDREPAEVTAAAFTAAAALMDGYFLPMAERTFGDAAVAPAERDAALLAKWIMRTKPDHVNARQLQRAGILPGAKDAGRVKAALEVLRDAEWVAEPGTNAGPGRARGDWPVNPALWPEAAS